MKEAKLTVLQRIGLACLWHGARLFALLPYWFKYYAVENLLYFLLFRCIRYRRRVVTTNLRNSFPEKSGAELRTIRRRFYRTLAEMIVDTIDLARIDERKVRRLLEIDDCEGHARATQGRDWIAMMPTSAAGSIVPTGDSTIRRTRSSRSIIRCGARSWRRSTAACATTRLP